LISTKFHFLKERKSNFVLAKMDPLEGKEAK
jgi:hypothetical protein